MCRNVVMLLLVLGLSSAALGVNADWGEEMTALPAASGWLAYDGSWMGTVTLGPGGTWIGGVGDGFARTTEEDSPLAGISSYTLEYKVRLLDPLDQSAVGAPIVVYNGGPDTARSRTFYGNSYYHGGDGCWIQDYPSKDEFASYTMLEDEWQVVRVVMDQANNTHKLFVNGILLVSNSGGASGYPDTDDPFLSLGSSPGLQATEWEYIRTYNGVLDGTTPLNAVPEPMTMTLLGLGALAVVRLKR